ncbi:hypothetical protein COV18_05780 [Candidatus Woesearchaeota archaeon CG10_big_fil_rev_8_21_14_0_10_37_12]|nr:MAG: hypothetical protein COV18_05780 [Candidatus Woesearchaeota archaeon CG10_big_fil_rev_8_21_14_0_10_37_12]
MPVSLEILATILVVLVAIKLLFVLFSPKSWLNFAKELYSKPIITQVVAVVLAAIVLCYLLQAGLTIVHILAVTLFLSLVTITGFAPHGKQLVSWANRQGLQKLCKEQWLHIVIWVVLILWGIKELFF